MLAPWTKARDHRPKSEAAFPHTTIGFCGAWAALLCRGESEIALAIGGPPTGSYPLMVRRPDEHFASISDTHGVRPVLLIDDGHESTRSVLMS